MMRTATLALIVPFALFACNGGGTAVSADNEEAESRAASASISPVDRKPFQSEVINDFDHPWAMAFLPGGMLLVTEKEGRLAFIDQPGTPNQRIGWIEGVPEVDYGGQGGLGDIVPAPDYEDSRIVYLSWAEAGEGDTRGAAVGRAKLVLDEADAGRLENLEVIWRQKPKVTGRGHYSHRIAFSPDGDYLFIASGDRQKLDPAQDLSNNLGTIVRLKPDGSVPADNPFADRKGASADIWSYGHRNTLGLAFGPDGRLWNLEHGPKGGDEINLVKPGANYGWPRVSGGVHYNGDPIPDHAEDGDYVSPAINWTPVIAPGNFIFYKGGLFEGLDGRILASGLKSGAIVQVAIEGEKAREVGRWDMGARIREVAEGPDGAIWVLEDGNDGSQGRLLKLTPAG